MREATRFLPSRQAVTHPAMAQFYPEGVSERAVSMEMLSRYMVVNDAQVFFRYVGKDFPGIESFLNKAVVILRKAQAIQSLTKFG